MPPNFPQSIQFTVLKILPDLSKLPLRDYHPLWFSVPGEFRSLDEDCKTVLQHHISFTFLQRIQFALICFQSLLLTESLLISFPPGTKTFQFPGFPDLTVSKEKSHSDILGSTYTCYSPRHFVACHVLHRRLEPSPPPTSVIQFH